MMKRFTSQVFCVLGLLAPSAHAQSPEGRRFEAIFLYNFSKYIEWKNPPSADKFVIGVVGTPVDAAAFATELQAKKTGNRSLEVILVDRPELARQCSLVFVTEARSQQLPELLRATKNRPVLVVTQQDGLIQQGSAINLVNVAGRIRFEVNKKVTQVPDFRFASEFLRLATVL